MTLDEALIECRDQLDAWIRSEEQARKKRPKTLFFVGPTPPGIIAAAKKLLEEQNVDQDREREAAQHMAYIRQLEDGSSHWDRRYTCPCEVCRRQVHFETSEEGQQQRAEMRRQEAVDTETHLLQACFDYRGNHLYLSTYCLHGDHSACRRKCKECAAPCRCSCHRSVLPDEIFMGVPLTDEIRDEIRRDIWREEQRRNQEAHEKLHAQLLKSMEPYSGEILRDDLRKRRNTKRMLTSLGCLVAAAAVLWIQKRRDPFF